MTLCYKTKVWFQKRYFGHLKTNREQRRVFGVCLVYTFRAPIPNFFHSYRAAICVMGSGARRRRLTHDHEGELKVTHRPSHLECRARLYRQTMRSLQQPCALTRLWKSRKKTNNTEIHNGRYISAHCGCRRLWRKRAKYTNRPADHGHRAQPFILDETHKILPNRYKGEMETENIGRVNKNKTLHSVIHLLTHRGGCACAHWIMTP